ncbi:MAG: anhydro-N-acetylmuramic acid kinase [Candidatus Limnocylindrales bacterium]
MRVIGMISGTSFDAVEAVAADLTLAGDVLVCDLLGHLSSPYPPALQAAVAAILPPAGTTIDAVCRLDTALGQAFASVAERLVAEVCDARVDVVCTHGQTVFHWVEGGVARGTLQLGQPAWIAERTGATVVSDVRMRDVASGGQGAPLASLLDVLLFGGRRDQVTVALNLGGIANVTVLDPERPPIAFDIGPANALIDAAVRWVTGGVEPFDHDGRRAAAGTVDARLLERLLADPYYAARPPKSTGKERFHLGYLLDALDGRSIPPNDLIATATALTAETVAAAVRSAGAAEVIASGGGTRNRSLMAEITRRLPRVTMRQTDNYGVPESAKEALLFAVIGFLTMHGLPGTIPSCTGARHASVLGSITPGRVAPGWSAAERMPTQLVIRRRLPTPEAGA